MFSAYDKGFPTIRRRLFILLATFSVGFFVVTSAHAADYYMSPSGNDSNPGTLAAPWKTIDRLHKAQASLRPGDTVWFRGGDYFINDSAARRYYPLSANGTTSAPISYRNYQGEKPVIVFDRMTGDAVAFAGFFTLSGDYIIFDGLNFRQTERSYALGWSPGSPYKSKFTPTVFYVEGSNVTIRNCSIENVSGQGVHPQGGSKNLLVEHSRFIGTGSHGFYITGSGGTYRYNVLDGSRGYPNQQGIQLQYQGAQGNKIYGNLIMNGQATGVNFSGRVSGNEVFNNVFINAGAKTGGGGGSGGPLGFWCEDGAIGPGNKFYNNTIIGKAGPSGLIGDSLPDRCVGIRPASRVEIYNNIFNTSSPSRIGLTQSYPNIRNNIFYNITGSVPAGNTMVNPNLVNPSGTTSKDAMLTAGSPAIDKAISPFPINDYQGGKRPFGAAADIGAFEFGAPPGPLSGPLGGGSSPIPVGGGAGSGVIPGIGNCFH